MMKYYAKLDRLGYNVLDLFELGLELEPGMLRQYFRKDMNSLRLLHYPSQAPDDSGVISARAPIPTRTRSRSSRKTTTAVWKFATAKVTGFRCRRSPIRSCSTSRSAQSVDRRHLLLDVHACQPFG